MNGTWHELLERLEGDGNTHYASLPGATSPLKIRVVKVYDDTVTVEVVDDGQGGQPYHLTMHYEQLILHANPWAESASSS